MYRILAVTAVPTSWPISTVVSGLIAPLQMFPFRDRDGTVFWSVDGRRPRGRAARSRPAIPYPGGRAPGDRDWIQAARHQRRP